MKKISILGSTGSIGTQSLDVIEKNPHMFQVEALACGRNTRLLSQQIKQFQPKLAVCELEQDALTLKRDHPNTEILWGRNGLIVAAASTDCDIVLNALVGMRGLEPTYFAVKAGKDIALANKETLVAGGELIMKIAREKNVQLLPVDSEHSAIFQALAGNEGNDVRRLLLTGSGGPFRGFTKEQLKEVTVEQALTHPNWVMGSKITIDSATLMNKGLEVIEARWLFHMEPEKIQVIVHPQSIIHSMVEYEDHSIMAQLGLPDMRIPISYALSYPKRLKAQLPTADFFEIAHLTFEKPDRETFRCLQFAYDALSAGGSYTVALNGANEVLVQAFLENRIKFIDIQNTIDRILQEHESITGLHLGDILEIDRQTREKVWERIRG